MLLIRKAETVRTFFQNDIVNSSFRRKQQTKNSALFQFWQDPTQSTPYVWITKTSHKASCQMSLWVATSPLFSFIHFAKSTDLEQDCFYELFSPMLISPECYTVLQSNHLRNQHLRASLVVQWLRICLPMQGTRVRALVWEDPTCRSATRPVSHNYWACASGACAPQQERPR